MSEVVSETEMVLRRIEVEMARCDSYIRKHQEAIDHYTKSRDGMIQEQSRIAGFAEMVRAYQTEADNEGAGVTVVEIARRHLARHLAEIKRIEADAEAETEKRNRVLAERSKIETYLEVAERYAASETLL